MRAIITGASSGIGLALARELAKRGYALALLAPPMELPEQHARELPRAVGIGCDVTDAAAVGEAVRRGEAELGGPFDVAVANAGVKLPIQAQQFELDAAEQIIRVNVLGMMSLFAAVIPSMVARRSGRFVGTASLAGLRGFPSMSVYSASKAAMQAFLEAARIELVPHGVGVTIVNPGFVATPMTEGSRSRLPFLVQPERAAEIIADGIERGKRVVEFPLAMSLLMRVMRYVPDALYERMTGRFGRADLKESK